MLALTIGLVSCGKSGDAKKKAAEEEIPNVQVQQVKILDVEQLLNLRLRYYRKLKIIFLHQLPEEEKLW